MMLPSVPSTLGRLTEVFTAALWAVLGKKNSLGLPSVKNACVILVDGLGSSNIESRAGHAPLIAAQLKADGGIFCGFPSTTVTSLSSLLTGKSAGQHGMVGYQILDPHTRERVNLLTGIKDRADAKKWQPEVTVSEICQQNSVECFFVGPADYENSGFSLATMPGVKYVPAKTIEDRFEAAAKILGSGSAKLVYLYVPELDQAAHSFGFKSIQWVQKLEDLESSLKAFLRNMSKSIGLLLTADHGIIDVPIEKHIYLDEISIPELEFVGGDPRVLFLYFLSQPTVADRSRIQEFLGKRAYVATRDEVIEANWFGETQDFAVARMPEIFLISIGETALYHRDFAKPNSLKMIGQHGSVSHEELAVPLLRFGGFQRQPKH